MESIGFDFSKLTDSNNDGLYEDGFFEITVLSLNTNPARNEWSKLYVAELPKIGIEVTEHISTGWDEIIPRTFGHNEGKPPSYSQGGYDIFLVALSWDLDFDPSGLFTETGLCGTGSCNNFYSYLNETVEELINDYTSELDFDKRIQKVKTLQKALAFDKPVIPLIYPQSHWGWGDDVLGIDSLLISVSAQEWGNVRLSSWDTVAEGTVPEGYVQDGFLPVNTSYIIVGLLSSAIITNLISRETHRH